METTRQMSYPADQRIDFRALYYALREKIWIIGIFVGVALFFAIIYLLYTPKVYAAATIVQVQQAPPRVLNIPNVNSEDLGSDELLKTIEQNLSSPALLEQVIKVLDLHPAELGLSPRRKSPYTENELIRALARAVTVKLMRGTRLISVVAENTDPPLAQRISSAIVAEYSRMNAQQHLSAASDTTKFLRAEALRLKQKLQGSEQALQDYKERTQAVSLLETQNIIVEKLKELNAKLTGAKSERLKLEADYAQAQKLREGGSPEELLQLPSVAESKAVLEQKRIVAEQEGLVANLAKRYGPLHPKLIQARGQLNAQRDELGRVITSAGAAIDSSYQAAKETEAKFEQALREQEQKALELNKLAIPYNVLQREVEGDRALYDSVLNRMKETDVLKSIEQDDVLVKAPALLPDRAIKPRRLLILAGSIVAGLLLGTTVVLGHRAFDTSLRTVDEAERFLGLTAVGVIPESKATTSPGSEPAILQEAGGAVGEGFRTLRTSLSLQHSEAKWNSIAFTSALPDEGKTFCAANYAIACAQQGLTTLLVDCDLRLRSLGKIFFADESLPGVSDLMIGDSILDTCVRKTNIDKLLVLTAGTRISNPLELLSTTGFAEIIKNAACSFDRIVVDTAPVIPVSDTLLILKNVDAVCLVLQAGKTSRETAARTLQKLAEAGRVPLGFVLNRVPAAPALAAYYGYSYSKYGEGVYPVEGETDNFETEIRQIPAAPSYRRK